MGSRKTKIAGPGIGGKAALREIDPAQWVEAGVSTGTSFRHDNWI